MLIAEAVKPQDVALAGGLFASSAHTLDSKESVRLYPNFENSFFFVSLLYLPRFCSFNFWSLAQKKKEILVTLFKLKTTKIIVIRIFTKDRDQRCFVLIN